LAHAHPVAREQATAAWRWALSQAAERGLDETAERALAQSGTWLRADAKD